MARKEVIKRDFLIDSAFLLAKQEGFDNVTARKLANKAGCSTQPIFRLYENMDELWEAVYEKAVDYYKFFYSEYSKGNQEPFVDLGMAYIAFAEKEKFLFRLLFVDEHKAYSKSLYDILNGGEGYVANELLKAKGNGITNAEDLFTKMWIFIHGAACMSLTGDYDLNQEQTLKLLKNIYRSFV